MRARCEPALRDRRCTVRRCPCAESRLDRHPKGALFVVGVPNAAVRRRALVLHITNRQNKKGARSALCKSETSRLRLRDRYPVAKVGSIKRSICRAAVLLSGNLARRGIRLRVIIRIKIIVRRFRSRKGDLSQFVSKVALWCAEPTNISTFGRSPWVTPIWRGVPSDGVSHRVFWT